MLKQGKTKSSNFLLAGLELENTRRKAISSKGFVGIEGFEDRDNLIKCNIIRTSARPEFGIEGFRMC